MIPHHIRGEILNRVRKAEIEHDVSVLLAVESGSRAWGFASPNSDFDARFIYVHRRDWYLTIDLEEKRDVIEYEIVDDIDLNGWDIRKALRLFAKSNPAFVEWIQSPLIYIERGDFASQCRAMLRDVYNCERGTHHYRSMAKTNYRGYLRAALVPLKKYFYVLRPLLSVRWIEAYQAAPPIEFQKLLHLIEGEKDLIVAIEKLLERKKNAPEMGLAPQVPSIHHFIEHELDRLENLPVNKAPTTSRLNSLNALFTESLSTDVGL
ncbi:MAG: nucleotidyltransferase domain-containing protein [Betaproteobacteria bacterium]|nr:MAG: nucleotidyltransferase domain-containing protein [Betaproteobacteria bacterium]